MLDLIDAIKTGNKLKINALASEQLITDQGRCNWENILILEKELPGVKIFPIEKDSFGWLIGGIRYNGVTYSYG